MNPNWRSFLESAEAVFKDDSDEILNFGDASGELQAAGSRTILVPLTHLGLIEASLGAAIEAGEIRPMPVKPLAHLLLGALDEAAMLVARDEDPVARAEVTATLSALLDGFAIPGGS